MPTITEPLEIRAFVAACLDPELLAKIQRNQDLLENQLPSQAVRWTQSKHIHLTLKFLGNVAVSNVELLKSGLKTAAQGCRAFELRVSGLGCFPSFSRPRVIWLGLEGELAPLQELQQKIERICESFGSHAEERRFQPHLTIGRVLAAGEKGRRVAEVVRGWRAGLIGKWTLREIKLIQSKLGPHGSTYISLETVALDSP